MQVQADRLIPADPDLIFELITTPKRLSEWNRIITRTIEAPAELAVGAQWVVQLHALGQTWPSRSTVETLDRANRRFSYRSQTDDGNPSHADWTWQITETPSGSDVKVAVDVHPLTFWRRVLFARIRTRQLRREIHDSLDQLAVAATHADS